MTLYDGINISGQLAWIVPDINLKNSLPKSVGTQCWNGG